MSTIVNDETDINDIRNSSVFRGISFSNYKKTEVKAQLIECLRNGKIEPACYWCAELICAGHYMDVWETIIYFMSKYIYLGNPKLVIYLDRRFQTFRNIVQQGFFLDEIQLRNHQNIRKLFAEIVCILSLSNKKPSFETIKINKIEEFDVTKMTDRLKAPSIKYIEDIFNPKDPKEIFIPINEFAYNISQECKNLHSACYWIEWIVEFDTLVRKRKEPCYCEKRKNYDVENKFKCDIIWILWDVLLYYCKEMKNEFIESIMNSLLSLFCIKYTNACSKKRKYILYFAVMILTEQVATNIELIHDKQILKNTTEKINNLYKQIKKNEQGPNTDYLFSNLDRNENFENTIKKLEIMNQFM
jgi:hypothetical protein